MDDIFEADKRKPKTSRGAWVIALLSLAIMFLLLGLVLGVYVLSPDNSTKPQALMASPTASADAISWDGAENGSDEPIVLSVYENPVVDIAAAYSKSVVSVKATIMTNNVASSMTSDSESGQETQSEEIAFGSGFIFDSDGYILTNHHVVKDATELSIMMSDGTEYPAETIGSDSFNDIAVLKINAPDLSMIPIGDSDKVQVGEMAIAIGNPLGEDLSGSVTVGYISAVNRRVQSNAYLQTDAAINPGNSGGPLLNINGEVIGINALKSTLAGYDERGIAISSEGIGFAIPINRAIDVAHQLMDTGTVVRPGIGIQFSALSDDEAET
ncbi:MAG: trypsin-like peptidase domain-containing protein, partial [Eubacteriales bacterium]